MLKCSFRLGLNTLVTRKISNVPKYNVISEVYKNNEINDKVVVKGWVKALRKMKENIFVDISDGSCNYKLQAVIPSNKKPANLTTGAAVIISGHLSKTPNNQLEVITSDVEVTGSCVFSDGYPFAPRKSYPSEYIRQYLQFRPRTNKFSSLLRIRHTATKAIHDYFHLNGYFNVHTPILTSNDCEGAGEVFTVQPENKTLLKEMVNREYAENEAYFNSKVFLTVSGQMHLEAVAHGLSKVYTFGPTFRAENSKSRLHLSEFYMVEAETAFVDNLENVMKFTEHLIKYISKVIVDESSEDLVRVNDSESVDLSWLNKPFVILTYDEAVKILEQNKKLTNSSSLEESGLTKEHELFLVNHCGGVPTFVINWPVQIKPFYMKHCTKDHSKVAAFDLLTTNVGEIVGGSLRENDYNILKSRLPPGKSELDWYLEIRKFGSVPTGGFGMGFERYLQFITGIPNIKDTIPFPRWPHNCSL